MASDFDYKVDPEAETDDDEEHLGSLYLGQIKILPEVRKCDLLNFKNQFNAAEKGLYAVDVLESDTFLDQEEIQEELRLRRSLAKNPNQVKNKGLKLSKSTYRLPHNTHTGQSGKKVISKIRIRSPAILSILSKVMQQSWGSRPRTFIRPFGPLIYFHSQVLEALTEIEVKWALESEASAAVLTSVNCDNSSEKTIQGGILHINGSAAAISEIRCYLQFMSTEILPLYTQFDNLDESSNPKIMFHDLWYLFKTNELVYRPVGGGAIQETNGFSLGQRAWRIHGTQESVAGDDLKTAHDRNNFEGSGGERTSFNVHCYYIDYTGEEFCVVTEIFEIHAYEGEKPVKSLIVFPYRFLADHEERLEKYIEYGHTFLHSLETRHAAYNWWSVVKTPRGTATTDMEGNDLKRAEYVESEVIVDFVEAFQACPSWKPVPCILKAQEPRRLTIADDLYTCWWSDIHRTKLLAETSEIIVLQAGISTYQWNKNLLDDQFLARVRENDKNNRLTTKKDLRECDLPLLPSRVFGYVLRYRKFEQLDVHGLSPVKGSSDGFDCLKINPQHKVLVKSLVWDHFQKKASDRRDGVKRPSLDWIKGKGKGLFILLHGVPGVGKTATAEAVAQASGRPLFAITCGDLGLTPTEVEFALRRIFRLANTWDCVLLLDEVDTFFSQRLKGDATLIKNALVSVFLRVLEYYDGLLFLTTNRPDALDEAFKSRIYLSLYYPQLDLRQTREIWEMNIDRLRAVEIERCKNTDLQPLQINKREILRLAEERFKNSDASVRWNGRQIRNAIQVASSLANSDAKEDNMPPRLTADNFKLIYDVTEDFDNYSRELVGKSDGELAYDRGDRADHWSPELQRSVEGHSYGRRGLFPPGRVQGFGDGVAYAQASTKRRRPSVFAGRGHIDFSDALGHSGQRAVSPTYQSRQSLSIPGDGRSETGYRPKASNPIRRHPDESSYPDIYEGWVNGGTVPKEASPDEESVQIGKRTLEDASSALHSTTKRRKAGDSED
ncbi:hypothetical protein ONS95_009147 [Cadophora gregata]|uniref:uncharacterized protein n=1 Tax=Cadophora gregata TaxID=51156 RepID=UPI0026DAA7EA|nr:uncharacterized protein ONS95_009147 [Cadophora gregata]KAK0124165.1 hypothetical protein ONS95_009147 [Cadophora gregata]KAK0130493.1 hypothetical protein ONS96_001012 [Cadophora gregata f. sp. sojae]